MITNELKDRVLSFFVDHADDMRYVFNIDEVAIELGLTTNVLDALLTDYVRRGFMELSSSSPVMACDLDIKVYDFIQSGGYRAINFS